MATGYRGARPDDRKSCRLEALQVVAGWFAFTVGVFVASLALGGTKTFSQSTGSPAGTESAAAPARAGWHIPTPALGGEGGVAAEA